jgi:predicted RecA/RadA family phage recombinase
MKTFVKQGDTLTVTAPAGGVLSGIAFLVGAALFGVAVTDAAAGDDVEMKRTGLFTDQPKAAGAAWVQGDILYWDNTAKNFTKTSASNTRAGVAAQAAQSADTVGSVVIGPAIG